MTVDILEQKKQGSPWKISIEKRNTSINFNSMFELFYIE